VSTLRSTVMSKLSAATPGRSICTHTSLPRRKASIGIAALPFDDRPSRPNSASKSRNRYLVAVQATANLANEIRNAAVGVAGDGALQAIGTAYRNFAHTNPGQFASTFLPPTSDNDDLANANRSLLDVFVLVYRAMGLTPDESHLAARSTRSAIHGFCALELASGTTPDHDDEYRHLLETLRRGLQPNQPTRTPSSN
jgi:hypothetical protein